MRTEIIVIGGPTASGKSKLALDMAEERNGVVINADSMQVYEEIPILTAQPSTAEQGHIPHLLYGFLPAREKCTVARWLKAAKPAIDDCLKEARTPIIVGGTGMYLKSLIEGMAAVPEIAENIRVQARQLLEKMGSEQFHGMLKERDPDTAIKLHPSDKQRLLRAWEVIEQTQRPLHEWQAKSHIRLYPEEQFRCYVTETDREMLYQRCDARLLEMVEDGALEEVRALMHQELDPTLPAMKALGVPELMSHLKGEASLEEAISMAQQSTRNFAKRQLTWFRNQFPDWQQLAA